MRIASYNIMSGGFNSYTYGYSVPDRLYLLRKAIKLISADFIGLIDTFRWRDIYTEKDLKKLFRYKKVFHINMDDTRVDKNIGIVVMTNLPVNDFKNVRLYNRDCIKITLIEKKKLIDVFTIYLDDVSEDVRLKEIGYLLKNITSKSTVIIGDLNAIDSGDIKESKKVFERYLLKNPDFIETEDYKLYFKPVFKDLIRAEAVKLIKSNGFKEAKNKEASLPTSPTKLHPLKVEKPLVRVDHILVSSGLKIADFKVHSGNLFDKASDHFPISVDISGL